MTERVTRKNPETTQEKLKDCLIGILKIAAAIGLVYVGVKVVCGELKSILS